MKFIGGSMHRDRFQVLENPQPAGRGVQSRCTERMTTLELRKKLLHGSPPLIRLAPTARSWCVSSSKESNKP
jgi:hypothetical protein